MKRCVIGSNTVLFPDSTACDLTKPGTQALPSRGTEGIGLGAPADLREPLSRIYHL